MLDAMVCAKAKEASVVRNRFVLGTVVGVLAISATALGPAAGQSHDFIAVVKELATTDEITISPDQIIDAITAHLPKCHDDKERLQLLSRRARALRSLHKFERATEDLRAALKLAPANVWLKIELAKTLIDMDQFEEARDLCFSLRMEGGEVGAEAVRTFVWLAVNGGNLDVSTILSSCDKLIEADGTNSWVYYMRGLTYGMVSDSQNFEKALQDFNKCISLGFGAGTAAAARPYWWRGMLHLGALYDPEEGLKDALMAIRLAPEAVDAKFLLGKYYFIVGKFEAASYLGRELTKRYPRDGNALRLYVFTLLQAHRIDDALALSEKLLEPSADYRSSNRSTWVCGHIYFAAGRYKEALRLMDLVANKTKSTHTLAPIAYLLSSCPDEKYRDGKRACELAHKCGAYYKRDHPVQFMLLAMAHAELGQFDEAVKHATKAVELLPKNHHLEKEYRSRLELFKAKKPFRFKPHAGIYDYLLF